VASRADIALILRRAGFTPRPSEVDAAARLGPERLVAGMLAPAGPDRGAAATPPPELDDPADLARELAQSRDATTRKSALKRARRQSAELAGWWVRRMVAAEQPFTEKMTFFWHSHFATSVQKVRSPALMLEQQDLFRRKGLGPFPELVLAVSQDPAMMRWLDTGSSSKQHPNENFAREMFELFVLGHGNYSEADVRQAARAFTGWRWRPATGFRIIARRHDDGTKTVLGRTGQLSGQDVIALATSLPASHRWIAGRIWSRFGAHAAPGDPVVAALLASAAFGDTTGVAELFRAVLLSPVLTTPAVRTGLLKQPIEWVVGAQRALGISLPPRPVLSALTGLGQVPFVPPSVGGWPEGTAWLSTSATAARVSFATALVAGADLSALADASPTARLDAAADLLAIDAWSSRTRAALSTAGGDPARLMTLALLSPEYQLA
jgi:uncharacterized protein (DUF1800 family)